MPLAAGDLLAAVVALGATGLGGLDRLAIDNGGTGCRLLAGGCSDLSPQGGVDVLPGAVVPPGVEVVADGLPGREVVGQHPPRTAAPVHVQGRVDDLPRGVLTGPPD